MFWPAMPRALHNTGSLGQNVYTYEVFSPGVASRDARVPERLHLQPQQVILLPEQGQVLDPA
jgi:hypothetical protein